MAFQYEHSARIKSPQGYRTFRRQAGQGGPGVDFVYGITENGEVELQSVRMDRERYTEEAAVDWLESRGLAPEEFQPAAELVENRGAGICLEHILTNATGCDPRYEELDGRRYMVVPMVMLTEGVHQGSKGPLYYPPAELAKTPAVWNTKPIVVYHPKINGMGVSACTHEILSSHRVGMVMGSRYEDGKLKAEAWLDDEKMDRVDPRIRQFIANKQVMEISTGLFTDNVLEAGDWRGEKYTHVARNYRPDHLALLPDETGACSMSDGAGLLRNSQGGVAPPVADERAKRLHPTTAKNAKRKKPSDKLDMTPEKACLIVRDGMANGVPLTEAQKGMFGAFCGQRDKPTANAEEITQLQEQIEESFVENAKSHNQLRAALQEALHQRFGSTAYIEDVYPKFFIYCRQEPAYPSDQVGLSKQPELYRLAYSLDGDAVKLADETPQDVMRVMEYQTKDGKYVANAFFETIPAFGELANAKPLEGESSMTKDEQVDLLIANEATGWDDDDRDFLLELDDRHFEKLVTNAVDPEEEPDDAETPNKEKVAGPLIPDGKKPGQNKDNEMVKDGTVRPNPDAEEPAQNAEQYIASAPSGIREVLQMGYESYQSQKKALIDTITANKANQFAPAYLAKQELQVLQGMASLAATPTRNQQAPQQKEPVLLWNGAAGAAPVQAQPGMVHNSKNSKPLIPPKLEFAQVD